MEITRLNLEFCYDLHVICIWLTNNFQDDRISKLYRIVMVTSLNIHNVKTMYVVIMCVIVIEVGNDGEWYCSKSVTLNLSLCLFDGTVPWNPFRYPSSKTIFCCFEFSIFIVQFVLFSARLPSNYINMR